ncbi:MAG: hypothetical protein JWO52_1550 [Gammaproteobacteria bacterium]|nr:hypothetical protein [Gammaproteobacteria bacterium]
MTAGTQTRIGLANLVQWYQCTTGTPTMTATKQPRPQAIVVERVQTGVRLEKRLLKVLKGLAEYLDLSLGDLLEGIALHALENKPPFRAATLEKIADLKRIYELKLKAENSHQLRET